MFRGCFLIIAMIGAAGAVSCDPGPEPPVPTAWKWVQVGGATAWLARRDQNLGAVVWVDQHLEASGLAGGGRVQGILRNSTGPLVQIDCHFGTASASITINGAKYDLAKGAVFLVHTRRLPIRVIQLTTDVEAYPGAVPAVVALSQNDPAVGAFVDAASSRLQPATGPAAELGPHAPAAATRP